jgi:hypothetical protein
MPLEVRPEPKCRDLVPRWGHWDYPVTFVTHCTFRPLSKSSLDGGSEESLKNLMEVRKSRNPHTPRRGLQKTETLNQNQLSGYLSNTVPGCALKSERQLGAGVNSDSYRTSQIHTFLSRMLTESITFYFPSLDANKNSQDTKWRLKLLTYNILDWKVWIYKGWASGILYRASFSESLSHV